MPDAVAQGHHPSDRVDGSAVDRTPLGGTCGVNSTRDLDKVGTTKESSRDDLARLMQGDPRTEEHPPSLDLRPVTSYGTSSNQRATPESERKSTREGTDMGRLFGEGLEGVGVDEETTYKQQAATWMMVPSRVSTWFS